MTRLPSVEQFESASGVRIYRIPVEAFPGFIAYTYLVLNAGAPILVDCGSGTEASNQDLLDGINALHDTFGEACAPRDISRILITHGHIDHHGGLSFIREHAGGAQVGIHPLDRRILVAYEERVIVASKNLRIYLQRAGVTAKLINDMMEMYGFAKRLIKSEEVDFLLEENIEMDGISFIHTPGHCPGQVCIRIDDVLLSADHILNRITPHQAPESITHYTGLGHYLESLEKISHVDGLRLGLGGHETAISDVYERVKAIRVDHDNKLNRILDIIRTAKTPPTISDVTNAMYPNLQGYNTLLGIEETGAHIEYLYERGQLAISNLDQVEQEDNPPLNYSIT